MDKLPYHAQRPAKETKYYSHGKGMLFRILILACLGGLAWNAGGWVYLGLRTASNYGVVVPPHAAEIVQKCRQLNLSPGPPTDFYSREHSDRYVPGTKPTLIRNASIWTGASDGFEVVKGDLLLDGGLIKALGSLRRDSLKNIYPDLVEFDVEGSWVTAGIVDLHSHLGVDSSPSLRGANDGNSLKGLVQPWLRSLDGLNTHDDAYRLSISGGVTTALVLPGSANAIGGQGFVIKLRPTSQRTPTSMLLEPPFSLNGTGYNTNTSTPPRWRQLKHACGENPSRVYSGTRMDTFWAFRQGYDTARKIKEAQDGYCSKALSGQWNLLDEYPEDLQWEALVDVLRGRVKVQTHCYEAVDLDDFVRLSNEFKFPIAAFHHAHETYLVPDLLKSAYGHPPAIALFATNSRYKREAYRGSEFAARILAENGLQVVMKSDHPVLNSRYLLYEAQQAYHYGLPGNLALAAVTSTPATVMGQEHRIGYIKRGYDADIVLWDSHPLALGAAPKQVWIDGIAQIESPFVSDKPAFVQHAPKQPDFDAEAAETVKYEGLPPLKPKRVTDRLVVFTNVSTVIERDGDDIKVSLSSENIGRRGTVVVKDGSVTCAALGEQCSAYISEDAEIINLKGGSVSPALLSFGSALGLQDIQGEASTHDGWPLDPLTDHIPSLIEKTLIRAVDGLQFATRDALIAYRAGVTSGIVAPKSYGFLAGISTVFATGAAHKLEQGAVIQEAAALHLAIQHEGTPSVSTQIAALRNFIFQMARPYPLVIEVYNADVMASLIKLKQEIEEKLGHSISVTFSGATEAHLLAKEIGEAGVGVILTPSRPFPSNWESRRILPGPPLTQENAISTLLAQNVIVGVAVEEQWSARNTRLDIAWAALEAGGAISETQALALASVNLEKLLGVTAGHGNSDLVATIGGTLLDFDSKVTAIISQRRGVVDLV